MKIVLPFILAAVTGFIACNNSKPDPAGSETCADSCCASDSVKAEVSLTAELTCPKCGHKKTETMPTEVCLIKYTCEECKTDLFPKEGDCCVFCTYSPVKCPSKQ